MILNCVIEACVTRPTGVSLTRLPRRVKDEYIEYVFQAVLDESPVLTVGLVGSFDTLSAPIGPVDVILVLGQSEWMGELVWDDSLTVSTWYVKKPNNNYFFALNQTINLQDFKLWDHLPMVSTWCLKTYQLKTIFCIESNNYFARFEV